jgi:UDP-4-amino-4,6-dideoxy-N-acetyl-beta-L-altrosamine transaminase
MMANEAGYLPYGRQSIDEEDIAEVGKVLRSDWLTGGPIVGQFESAVAALVGARSAVAFSSGTAALHMATLGIGLGAGDTVVVPTLTFLATANAARFTGADVVFADVDSDTGLMECEQLERALAEVARQQGRLKAVFSVDFAGQAVPSELLRKTLEATAKADVAIIEDGCHAFGSQVTVDGAERLVGGGSASAATAFSFHPVKTIAMGEGGVVTTEDDALARKLRVARNHGIEHEPSRFVSPDLALDRDGSVNPWYYEMQSIGFNYRASAIHCALGLSQLRKFQHFVSRRRALASRYDSLLRPFAPVVRPLKRRPDCNPAWHLYVVRIDFASARSSRAAIMCELAAQGIGTQVHYLPLHLQPYYRERYGSRSLPGAEALYRQMLSLPLFPGMSDDDVDRVVQALSRTLLH